jgi:hypothetical protein
MLPWRAIRLRREAPRQEKSRGRAAKGAGSGAARACAVRAALRRLVGRYLVDARWAPESGRNAQTSSIRRPMETIPPSRTLFTKGETAQNRPWCPRRLCNVMTSLLRRSAQSSLFRGDAHPLACPGPPPLDRAVNFATNSSRGIGSQRGGSSPAKTIDQTSFNWGLPEPGAGTCERRLTVW